MLWVSRLRAGRREQGGFSQRRKLPTLLLLGHLFVFDGPQVIDLGEKGLDSRGEVRNDRGIHRGSDVVTRRQGKVIQVRQLDTAVVEHAQVIWICVVWP